MKAILVFIYLSSQGVISLERESPVVPMRECISVINLLKEQSKEVLQRNREAIEKGEPIFVQAHCVELGEEM